jgi:thymidylate synthase
MDRTGTGTISVFGRQIRHKMSEGFPAITTKKMAFKTMVTELLWFLRGSSDIRFLWENNCTIWDGDWEKNYKTICSEPYTIEEVKQKVKDGNHYFNDSMFDMGPIYGKQWRSWGEERQIDLDTSIILRVENGIEKHPYKEFISKPGIDQIANLINDLKTNPDSRRLMVNAWNVGELDQMVLPPCHYGFQVYTRELSLEEKEWQLEKTNCINDIETDRIIYGQEWEKYIEEQYEGIESTQGIKIPTRAISLMWNQRSVDTFLGLPFNIASYGLLLEIIAKLVNMVPDELIGNLGDTHLYLNHIEQAKEQIGKIPWEERKEMLTDPIDIREFGNITPFTEPVIHHWLNYKNIPYSRRMPYQLPTLNINTEWWPTESGESGIGPISTDGFLQGLDNNIQHFIRCLIDDDLQLVNYQSHPPIKAPLSN